MLPRASSDSLTTAESCRRFTFLKKQSVESCLHVFQKCKLNFPVFYEISLREQSFPKTTVLTKNIPMTNGPQFNRIEFAFKSMYISMKTWKFAFDKSPLLTIDGLESYSFCDLPFSRISCTISIASHGTIPLYHHHTTHEAAFY